MGDNKIMNPQRALFKEFYCNPESETFGNAYQSAIKAGFSNDYSTVIASPSTGNEWVKEILKDAKMLSLAEKVLKETLEMETGEDVGMLKIKQDSAKFVAKGLGKQKWSERFEHTGKEGQSLPSPILINAKVNVIQPNDGNKENPPDLQED